MSNRIRLLVAHDRNRELLAEWLDGAHDVETAPDARFEETDLCVLDEAGFDRYRDRIVDWKSDADPVFAPALLVTERGDHEAIDPADWETVDGLYVVDDLVAVPVEKAVFHRRIENLLSRRELSTDLAQSYRRSEDRFASLFHATPDPALILAEGHITYVNDVFCQRFGVDREDVRWRHLAELDCLPPDTVEQVESQIESANAATDGSGSGDAAVGQWASDAAARRPTGDVGEADAGTTTTATVVVETPAGETRYVETNVRPLTVDDRRSVALVMRDVTERRERKRALERQNERLEQFASIVSHDLRNPLQVLEGRLQQLSIERARAEDPGAVDFDAHLSPMGRAVDRMGALVEDLLALARQGAAVDDPERVGLAPVARRAWETSDVPDGDLTVRTDRAVRADESRLRQLFENLFRNAADHAAADGAVAVTVGDLAGGDGFYVADDGPGVPADEREQVFEMGYTTDDAGTGLGLGIVAEVADAHGWEPVVTESNSGGARFEFRGVGSS